MAKTQSNPALRAIIWAKELFREVLTENWFAKKGLMGKGINNIVQTKTELEKAKGEKVTFGLVKKLRGEGVDGDGTLEGNEEALQTEDFELSIDYKRNAVRSTGELDEQKSAYDLNSEFKTALAGWMKELIVMQLFLKLGGILNTALKNVTGRVYSASCKWSNTPNAVPVADLISGEGDRYMNANKGKLADLAATDIITPELITSIKTKAELAEPEITPLEIDGGKYYVMFVHPWQFADLRSNAVIVESWQHAEERGSKNPIFTGEDTLTYDGVIVKKHPYVPYLNPADVSGAASFEGYADADAQAAVPIARAIFCGRQAAVMAQCKSSNSWNEDTFDYGNQKGVATGLMGGVAKTFFDNIDFAVIVLDTAVRKP